MLFLTLNIFSSIGGIQTACRSLAFALGSIYRENLSVLALNDETADDRYIRPPHFKGYKRNKICFVLAAVKAGTQHQTIMISHINLLPLTFLIKILNRQSKVIMLAHGTEIYRPKAIWEKWFIRKYVNCWAVSDFTAQNLQQLHGIDKKIQVINNCLDPFFHTPNRFFKPTYLLDRYKLSPDQPILITICRIGRSELDKGYDKIINLLNQISAQFPQIHYLLCGKAEKSEKHRLQALIEQNLLQAHVTLTGPIPEHELTDHYLLADTFILPSSKEGFGIVFIEAAACGCQLIAGASDGSRDALLNGRTGILADTSQPEELYHAIISQLKTKRNKKDKTNQQELAVKHFGYTQYESKIRHLLTPSND